MNAEWLRQRMIAIKGNEATVRLRCRRMKSMLAWGSLDRDKNPAIYQSRFCATFHVGCRNRLVRRNITMTEAQRVYRELKQDVVTCRLAPGLSISELEMCTRYGASRTPVREACRRLTEESLMQMVPFRGYSITPLTIEEYRNLHELQTIVEPVVAGLAAERATPEQLKEIEGWATYEYNVGQKNSYYTFLEWNRNFHISIAAASRNKSLLEIVTNAQTRLMRYYYLVIIMDSYGPQLVSEHREMVWALRAGNATLARERANEHLEATVQRSMKVSLPSMAMPVYDGTEPEAEEWLWRPGVPVSRAAAKGGGRRRAKKPAIAEASYATKQK